MFRLYNDRPFIGEFHRIFQNVIEKFNEDLLFDIREDRFMHIDFKSESFLFGCSNMGLTSHQDHFIELGLD